MENHHAINGKIHYFDWAIFHCYVNVHQRVNYGVLFLAMKLKKVTIAIDNYSK